LLRKLTKTGCKRPPTPPRLCVSGQLAGNSQRLSEAQSCATGAQVLERPMRLLPLLLIACRCQIFLRRPTRFQSHSRTCTALKGTDMTIATANYTDAEIQRDVQAELKWEPRVQATEIGVAVKDGVVTLTGWVDSYSKRWAAEEAAHRVRGVKAVANDIEVRLGVGGERTDAEIAAAAARALQWDALLVPDKIEVTVSKGWVTLKGTVEWQYKKSEAERAVRYLAGVKGVSNLIEVKPKAQPAEIKKQVEQALVRSAQTDAQNITVEVEGSKVILKGKVRSWAERQEAERAAWKAPGVASVDNRITIGL
jgi:osmotically-inducible protein OsmY